MKITKQTNLSKITALIVRFPVTDIDKAYNKQLQEWLWRNSHEQEPLPESKDGIKRLEFDKKGFITNVSFSGTTKSGFKLLEQDFINEILKRIYSIDIETLDLDKRKYLEFLKDYFENKEVKPQQENTETILKKVKNNFDSVSIVEVYQYFKKELVDKNRMDEADLIPYLKCAFDDLKPPSTKFTIKKRSQKEIRKIFYNYYETTAGKPHGKQSEYLGLLKDYFKGFEKESTTNFSKTY